MKTDPQRDPHGAPSRPRFDLGELLRLFGTLFLASNALSSTARKVFYRIMACRTEELGGHIDMCDDCGKESQSYNSCGDRHCPKCQGGKAADWVKARMATFLPTHSFHTVFTVPDLLRPLFLGNRELMYNLLFSAVSKTLLKLAADPKWLGAQIGFTLVLHTWAKDMINHPHLHGVVTGGGLVEGGLEWKSARGNYLIPKRVMSAVFRGKFLEGLKKLYREDALQFKGSQAELARDTVDGPANFQALLDKLYTRNWVVYAKKPFSTPEHVYRYLSRYTHRVAMSNHRILEANKDEVRLRTRGTKSVILPIGEFFRRFALHVLPDGYRRIRHYGLMSSTNCNTRLEQARALLVAEAKANGTQPKDSSEPPELEKPVEFRSACTHCGSTQVRHRHLVPKQRGPSFELAFGPMRASRKSGVAPALECVPP